MEADPTQGPDVVPGVTELRRLGVEPVEECTGALWVADVWPDDHRRFVPQEDADFMLPGVADFLRWDESEAARWRPGPETLEE